MDLWELHFLKKDKCFFFFFFPVVSDIVQYLKMLENIKEKKNATA